MIEIIYKNETDIYQIYHLVKAFYPFEDVVSRKHEGACFLASVDYHGKIIFQSAAKEMDRNKVFSDLYLSLCVHAGKELPWGMLTGVRPTKLAMSAIKKGQSFSGYRQWIEEKYHVSEGKASLSWNIASREYEVLKRHGIEGGFSLYVGIPFCPSICSYCSFSSGAVSQWKGEMDHYVAALIREIKAVGQSLAGMSPTSLYIGGGTPTTLSEIQMDLLLSEIEESIPLGTLREYTVEAGRPDTISEGILDVLRRHRISRISINPQTMQDKTLRIIGRQHTASETIRAYHKARDKGFDNINMDLIAGLEGETPGDMKETLEKVESLQPDSLTVHALAKKRAALMDKSDVSHGQVIEDMMILASRSGKRMQMHPYYLYRLKDISGNFENVGYSQVDKAGLYNILMMEEIQTILAVGAGATTKVILEEPVVKKKSGRLKEVRIQRYDNIKAIDGYIGRIDEIVKRKRDIVCRLKESPSQG